MKRLLVCAVSAAASCSSLALVVGTAPPAAVPATTGLRSGTYIPAPGRVRTHAARGVINTGSSNWSGYVQVAAKRRIFTGVTDTLVVPTVTSSIAGSQYVADWVGIGGYNDRTLVQDGIQATVTTSDNLTTVVYDAWTEVLPQAERPLKLVVNPGDAITATVQETTPDRWLMTVADVTTKKSDSRLVRYRSSGFSAEAIHERPCIAVPCSAVRNLATLAQTTNVTFEPGSFSETPPGQPPSYEPLLCSAAGPLCPVVNATLYGVSMDANDGTTVIAVPSLPNTAENGFTLADGDVAPPPPA